MIAIVSRVHRPRISSYRRPRRGLSSSHPLRSRPTGRYRRGRPSRTRLTDCTRSIQSEVGGNANKMFQGTYTPRTSVVVHRFLSTTRGSIYLFYKHLDRDMCKTLRIFFSITLGEGIGMEIVATSSCRGAKTGRLTTCLGGRNILHYLKEYGSRPLPRFVLMSGHVCHLRIYSRKGRTSIYTTTRRRAIAERATTLLTSIFSIL